MFIAGTVTSSPATEIRAPTIVDETLVPLKTFDVNVTLVNVTNLYGWNVVLSFNPGVLEATAVTIPVPNFLGPTSAWAVDSVQPVIDNFMGTAIMGDKFLPPLPLEGVNGSGTLATVTFRVKAGNAISPLTLQSTELYMIDVPTGDTIQIPHETIDGLFDNRETKLRPVAFFDVEPRVAYTSEQVTFNASKSNDLDGTIISYEWNFGDGSTTTVYNPIVTHNYTAAGTYNVALIVTDNDNLNSTATDIVQVLAHDIAIISVLPSPTTVKTGESVSISVTIINEGNFTETFNVTTYYSNIPIETQTAITLTSGNSITLAFNWIAVDVAAGDYTIKAVASRVENETDLNDNTYTDNTVIIEKQGSQITISVNPSTITVGENTTVSGTLTPTRAGATVTIQYKPTEGDWSILETVVTNLNGQYAYNWSPETAGTYKVRARWEGDLAYLSAESNVDFVTIRKATAVNIYLFAVAGVGIVIVAAIALYFLRVRKKKER